MTRSPDAWIGACVGFLFRCYSEPKSEALAERLAEDNQLRADAQSAAVEAHSQLDGVLRRAAQAEQSAATADADRVRWREKANEQAEDIKSLRDQVAQAQQQAAEARGELAAVRAQIAETKPRK